MRTLNADDVGKLSDIELRQELEERGTPVGPISDFTRPLLRKMLLKKLGLYHVNEDSDAEPASRSDGWASQAVEGNAADDADAPPAVYQFFGVHLPTDTEPKVDASELLPVYTDKAKCLAAMKLHKGTRFKTFKSYDEAFHFSECGPEVNLQASQQQDTHDGPSSNTDGGKAPDTMSNLEKSSLFRGPSSQDRVKFRKAIEKQDIELFNRYVCSNPRYLVSTSDSPTILKEGSRYNAIHVACCAGLHHMLRQILKHLSHPVLFEMLYPDDTASTSTRRQQYLLDLYLNMPDKGMNETPLHIACKLGHVECVKLLTSYTLCHKHALNKYRDQPKDVVCGRYSGSNPVPVKMSILELLEPQYYVPVLRDPTYTFPPIVGHCWSPNVAASNCVETPEFAADLSNLSLTGLSVSNLYNNTNNNSYGLFNTSFLDNSLDDAAGKSNAAKLRKFSLASPLTCSRKVEALLGPLPLSKAESVRKRWREASRLPKGGTPVTAAPLPTLFLPTLTSQHQQQQVTPPVEVNITCSTAVKLSEILVVTSTAKPPEISGTPGGTSSERSEKQKVEGPLISQPIDSSSITSVTPPQSPVHEQATGTPQQQEKTGVCHTPWTTILETPTTTPPSQEKDINIEGTFVSTPLTTDQHRENDDTPVSSSSPVSITPGQRIPDASSVLLTPVRTTSSSRVNAAITSTPRHRDICLPDYQKGLEVVGRQLAEEYNTDWLEYWDFLGEFANFEVPLGRERLERHLRDQYSKVIDEDLRDKLCRVQETLTTLDLPQQPKQDEDDKKCEASSEEGTSGSNSNHRNNNDVNNFNGSCINSENISLSSTIISNTSSSSSSSLGSLCRGLEAIRLNASMSPNTSHYSPAAQKRYEELLDMLQYDQQKVLELFSSMTMPDQHQPLNLSTDALNMSLRSSNWELLSYVAQSCVVTSRTLASVLEDLAHDVQEKGLPQLALVKTVKSKLAGEILALHVVINRYCANNNNGPNDGGIKRRLRSASKRRAQLSSSILCDTSTEDVKVDGQDRSEHNASALEKSINELGASFIHGLVTIETLKLLLENLMPSDILSLLQVMKTLVSNLNFIDIASSDEDDDEDQESNPHQYRRLQSNDGVERKDQAMHIKCIVVLLEKALRLSTKDGCESTNFRIPSVIELGECNCLWEHCCVTLAALAEYANTGSFMMFKNSSKLNSTQTPHKSNTKFKSAHSFLHKTVFGEGCSARKSTPRSSVLKSNNKNTERCIKYEADEPNVVKQLTFENEIELGKQCLNEKIKPSQSSDSRNNCPKIVPEIMINGTDSADGDHDNKHNENNNTDGLDSKNTEDNSNNNENNGGNSINFNSEINITSTESNLDSGSKNNITSTESSCRSSSDDSESESNSTSSELGCFSKHYEDCSSSNIGSESKSGGAEGKDSSGGSDEEADEDNDSFATAASSSYSSSLATPEQTKEFFINGATPGKVDLDVLLAVAGSCSSAGASAAATASARVDEQQYPHLAQWQILVQEKQQLMEADNADAADGDAHDVADGEAASMLATTRKVFSAAMFESPYSLKPQRRRLLDSPLMTSSPRRFNARLDL